MEGDFNFFESVEEISKCCQANGSDLPVFSLVPFNVLYNMVLTLESVEGNY